MEGPVSWHDTVSSVYAAVLLLHWELQFRWLLPVGSIRNPDSNEGASYRTKLSRYGITDLNQLAKLALME